MLGKLLENNTSSKQRYIHNYCNTKRQYQSYMKLREREYGRSLSDLTNHLGREKQSLLKSSSIYIRVLPSGSRTFWRAGLISNWEFKASESNWNNLLLTKQTHDNKNQPSIAQTTNQPKQRQNIAKWQSNGPKTHQTQKSNTAYLRVLLRKTSAKELLSNPLPTFALHLRQMLAKAVDATTLYLGWLGIVTPPRMLGTVASFWRFLIWYVFDLLKMQGLVVIVDEHLNLDLSRRNIPRNNKNRTPQINNSVARLAQRWPNDGQSLFLQSWGHSCPAKAEDLRELGNCGT